MAITKATASAVAPAAKGDLVVGSATNDAAVLSVGSANQVLTVDSSTTTGLKWASAGITWTQRLGLSSSTQFRVVSYNGSNLWVAAGQAGLLYSSSDGITWTSRTSGFGSNAIYDVKFGNGLWVAVGDNGTITTSSDGITWTARTANMGTNRIQSVIYDNSLWVAVGGGGGTTNTGGITYSSDGITWTRKSQSLTVGSTYYTVIWNGTNWVVGANNSTNNTLTATTPSGTWTASSSGSAAQITQIFWDGTRHYYTSDTGSNTRWYYSTATNLTSSVDTQFAANDGNNNNKNYSFYNGEIYGVGTIVQRFTPATGVPSTSTILGISPTSQINSTGLKNDGNAIWAGAAGIIVTDGIGRIFTSF